MKAAAIILAAGFSSRMGRDKALLDLGGQSALERIVSSYQSAGVRRIMVVTGQNHTPLRQLNLNVELVRNPVPEEGMFSSVKSGVVALGDCCDPFFIHPVDTPLVCQHTLHQLFQTLEQQIENDAVIPCCTGKRGHPPLLHQRLRDAIRTYTGINGLRGLLVKRPVVELTVSDQGVLLGMNTPQQYEALQQYLGALGKNIEQG